MRQHCLLILALMVTGCSQAGSGTLEGSATSVPLFQPSRLQNFKTVKVEWVENNKRETNEWTWKTSSPIADLKAFYKNALPGAKIVKLNDDTVYTWTGFPGADKDEDVTVVVEDDGTFRISERLAPKKTKHRDEIVKAFPKENDLPEKLKK